MKKPIAIATLIAAGMIATGCTVTAPAPDEAGIVYNAGPVAKTEFQSCVEPGGRDFSDPLDVKYLYPAGQRTLVFSHEGENGKGRDRASFSAPTKDQVNVTIDGQVRFRLNTDCDTLRKFHEAIGLKFQNDGKVDWTGILATYLEQPLNRAITEATQGFGWAEVYSDPAKKAEWEHKVKDLLPKFVEQAAGGKYFTDIDVTLQKPILPADLQKALEAAQTAAQQAKAQEQRNVQVDAELEAIRKLVAVLGQDGYIVYKAIQDGKVTVIPVPQGSPVVVPGK